MNLEEDEEIERIKARKVEAILEDLARRKQVKQTLLVTDSNFDEVVSKHTLLVIDCWAPWCEPCKIISPVIDELAIEYRGKIVFGKLNVDENPKTSIRFNISSIPTILIFKEGILVDEIVGAIPKHKIVSILQKYI
ncbi:MAG: thioredoxin [Thermoproteota archaeon]